MTTMKSVPTAGPGTIEVAEIERPVPGPRDLLVRIHACGICGTDATFVQMGGMPLRPDGQTAAIPLGHEPAGEVVEVGAEVAGLQAGGRGVVNPQAALSGIIGCGGALGGMTEYLLIENAVAGKSVTVFPGTLPFEAAALNERWRWPALRQPVRSPDLGQGGSGWVTGHRPARPGASAEVIGQPRTTAPGERTRPRRWNRTRQPDVQAFMDHARAPRNSQPSPSPIMDGSIHPEIPGQIRTYFQAGSCHA